MDWIKNTYALTGNIGSGKSSVAKILRKCGALVIDADQLAREVIKPGSATFKKVISTFGKEILKAESSQDTLVQKSQGAMIIDRKKLAQIVFSSPKKLKILEDLIHPAVQKLAKKYFLEAIESTPNKILIYECPLLFEKKLHLQGFRKIILVTANKKERLKRVALRDGSTLAAASKREALLTPQLEKIKLSDYVIKNQNISLAELERQVKELFSNLKSNV